MSENLHQHFYANPIGRDFFVGDVHGCFYFLDAAMAQANFNPQCDRLFSTGDLVDRGEFSAHIIDWLARPYFHAVRGNHEHVLLEAAAGRADTAFHQKVMSADWWYDSRLSTADKKKIIALVATMPLVVTVDAPNDKVIGMVHADVWGNDWQRMLREIESQSGYFPHIEKTLLWSRYKIMHNDNTHIEGIDAVVVGHSVVSSVKTLGNVVFIDTGMGTNADCQAATLLEADQVLNLCAAHNATERLFYGAKISPIKGKI